MEEEPDTSLEEAIPAGGSGSPFLEEIVAVVGAAVPGGIARAYEGLDMPTLEVAPAHWRAVCRALRDAEALQFRAISDLTAVDHLGREPRFDVVCHLCSHHRRAFVRVKTGVPEDPARCPSLVDVYPGANWLEREVYDMFGIEFEGHPDLERILTPEGWEWFALRRDFPLQGPFQVKLYDSVSDVF
jgi:NADH-quinone oxidoreductase subunit C